MAKVEKRSEKTSNIGFAGNQYLQNSDLCVTFFGSAIVVIEIRDRHKQNPLFVGRAIRSLI